jgi:hypothetical protein
MTDTSRSQNDTDIANTITQSLAKTPKQEFSENVQKWVLVDDQLKKYNEQLRKLREYRGNLTQDIHNYMHNNQLQNVSIGISDGELKLADKREYSPLTFTYIKTCLTKIIHDPNQVDRILVYLRENREIKTSADIRRRCKK